MLNRHGNQGFSLIEILVTLTVIAALVTIAVPSLISYTQKNRLIGVTQQLYDSLQFARSQAVKTNSTIYVSFTTGSNWCYGINSGTSCSCTVANSCGLGATSAANSTSLTMTASGLNSSSVKFEPNHGAANANSTITFTTGDSSAAISVKINLLGSILICSTLTGYQACS